jgi:cell division protein FtsX
VANFVDSVAKFDSIRVYPTADNRSIKATLEDIEGIEGVIVYLPQDSKGYIEENAPSVGGISTLPTELFPTFFELKVADSYREIETLDNLSAAISALDGVEAVSYGGDWAKRLSTGANAIKSLLILLAILFSIASAVIIYQIIHITLHGYADEIHTYSIVGGTNIFIILPFIVMAACIGAICTAVSYAGYTIIYLTTLRSLESLLGFELSLPSIYALIFVLAAIVISQLSGFLSASIFLKRLRNGQDEQNEA